MSETTAPKTTPKISDESARAQILKLFESFEVPTLDEDGKEDPFIAKLAGYVARGRLVVDGDGDDVKLTQNLRGTLAGAKSVVWNWSRLGMGKSRVKVSQDGTSAYGNSYTVAAPMIGYDVTEIQKLHPVDLSIVEDIANFFQKI